MTNAARFAPRGRRLDAPGAPRAVDAVVAAALVEGRLGAAAIRAPDFDRALGDVGHHSGAKFPRGLDGGVGAGDAGAP